MTEANSIDFPGEDRSKLPGMLNVLTILTIIGSIFGLLGSLWNFFMAKQNYEKTKDLIDSGKMDSAPGWAKGMVNADTLMIQQKMVENKFPMLILGIIASAQTKKTRLYFVADWRDFTHCDKYFIYRHGINAWSRDDSGFDRPCFYYFIYGKP